MKPYYRDDQVTLYHGGRSIALTLAGDIRRHLRGNDVCPGTGRIG